MPNRAIKLLVVDDNPATRYSTSHVLRSAGFTVLEAATGAEALQKIENPLDLVILDVHLPDFDGFEVCRRIRAIDRLKRLPLIHLSATFVKDIDKAHGLDVGADGYLTHPVEPPVLIATVNAFLRARKAENELEELLVRERSARADAETANRIKDEFLATLSHELRTPLHAMLGWAQFFKLGKFTPAELTEGLESIERNAQAQGQLIADLLDISRIISGKLRLDVQPVDPAATIEAALTAMLPAADAKGVRITKMFDSAAGPIEGDPSRLQQVIWNLVSNAVKFTPKGGRIQVTLERIDSHVRISVADNGQGIDAELLPHIFERFQQGDSSTTRKHGGLGLGLAIAKQLVELHGGTISVESAGRGLGSKFSLLLPLSPTTRYLPVVVEDRKAVHADDTSHEPDVRLDGVRVLIVDDEVDSRRMVSTVLSKSGAVVRECDNAESGFVSIDGFQPHVLLSDLGMPNQDGYELVRRVRAAGHSGRKLPAIALTGFARSEDRRRALLSGFQLHMSKPVDPRELTAAIAALVDRDES